jgi:DNA primase
MDPPTLADPAQVAEWQEEAQRVVSDLDPREVGDWRTTTDTAAAGRKAGLTAALLDTLEGDSGEPL